MSENVADFQTDKTLTIEPYREALAQRYSGNRTDVYRPLAFPTLALSNLFLASTAQLTVYGGPDLATPLEIDNRIRLCEKLLTKETSQAHKAAKKQVHKLQIHIADALNPENKRSKSLKIAIQSLPPPIITRDKRVQDGAPLVEGGEFGEFKEFCA